MSLSESLGVLQRLQRNVEQLPVEVADQTVRTPKSKLKRRRADYLEYSVTVRIPFDGAVPGEIDAVDEVQNGHADEDQPTVADYQEGSA